MTFHIVATGFNCSAYVDKCVQSVFKQTQNNWCLHLVSDGSTDSTGELCLKYQAHKQIQVSVYSENIGAAFRRMQVIRNLPADDVVLLLGLDDELLPECLARVQKEYDNGKLMTYGNWKDQFNQTLPANFDLDFDEQTHKERNYRRVKYRSTAPNTFKVFLFNRIPDEDFQINGKWTDSTTESETMFSCLEMSGQKRIGVIKDIIYLYNRALPNGTLKRLGVEYKMKILAQIMSRPKKELYEEETIPVALVTVAPAALVTVALPVFNSPFAWFAMEGLCRQETSVLWELVVFEDADNPNGEEFYSKYISRMKNCCRIIYIYSPERISLAEKWCVCAEHSDQKSVAFLLQSGDDYSPPTRIETTFRKIAAGVDWYEHNNGLFFNLRTKQMLLYTKGFKTATGVYIAMKTSLVKAIEPEEQWSSVDFWLFTNCQKLKPNLDKYIDISNSFALGLFTDGAETISKHRKRNYDKPLAPFSNTRHRLQFVLSAEVIARLAEVKFRNELTADTPASFLQTGKDTEPITPVVLNISTSDWANYAQDNCASLNAAGVHCEGLKLIPHSFGYAQILPVVTAEQMKEKINSGKFNVIQIFNSDATMIALVKGFKGQVIVYHTGSNYRMKHKMLNAVFNSVVHKSVIALGEFDNLGAKNSSYVSVAVDIPKQKIKQTNTLKFLHCPSNEKVKGTATIVRLMKDIDCTFRCDTRILQHKQNIERMKDCDVYIELLNPSINGDKYGSFGTTAVEAAMLGKIVVTQNLSSQVYSENYGACPLVLVKDEKEFVEKVNWLLSLSPEEIVKLKKEHQDWSIEKHSYKATGERIKKILLQA